MDSVIMNYAPSYWDKHSYRLEISQFDVDKNSDEYIQVQTIASAALCNKGYEIKKITRIQNVFDLGQFLVRGQLLAVLNQPRTCYEVRRFITLSKQYLTEALQYNLDPRRCGRQTNSLTFSKTISNISPWSDYLVIVKVITCSPNENCLEPVLSTDYIIDYIVEIQ